MKLYYTSHDNSLAVRISIHEMGIKCEYESVDLQTKVTETGADFFKINPKGQIPALLLDDGTLLTENAIIQQYLANKNHKTELLPPEKDFSHYRVLEWLNFISTEIHKTCSCIYNKGVPENIKDTVFKVILKRKFDYVENHLSKNKYLMGDQFTLADGYLFTSLTWFPHMKMDLHQYPHLTRYYKDLMKRKSVIQALEEEGLTKSAELFE